MAGPIRVGAPANGGGTGALVGFCPFLAGPKQHTSNQTNAAMIIRPPATDRVAINGSQSKPSELVVEVVVKEPPVGDVEGVGETVGEEEELAPGETRKKK